MSSKNKVLCAARRYLQRGWRVIPIPPREKAPRIRHWQEKRIEESEVSDHFRQGDNIGILLGKPSRRLVDIDLDCDEAIFLASSFLPHTGRRHGRKSKPNSHYFYYVKPTPSPEKFSDVDGRSIVELRSTGQQTIVAPSRHPSGERIKWIRKKKPARVKAKKLRTAVSKLASAAILARHWPKRGSRNEAALALAGLLLRADWEEDDAAEFVASVAQAAEDEEWESRRTSVIATAKRFRKGKDITGRPRLAELVGENVVERACSWLAIGKSEAPVDRTSAKRSPWPKSLCSRAFCGLAGDAVRLIEPQSEADPAALLVQILIAFGSAVGSVAYFEIEAARHGPNLFSLIVGRTSRARKGTAWSHVLRIFRGVDPVWCERRVASGLSSGEGLIHAVRDRIEKRKRKGTEQEDEETMTEELEVEDKRLMVVETEFAAPLRVQRREGNTLSAQIRQAWDNGNLRVMTKNAPVQATDAHISIIGHITQEELRRELTFTDEANGFANRFLYVCAKRSKLLPLGGNVDFREIGKLAQQFSKAIKNAQRVGRVRFSSDARDLWVRKYPKLTAEVPGMLGAVISRAEAQVLRLALVYALTDCSRFIEKKHLRAALAVWRYCADSARYIFGDALGDRTADELLSALRQNSKGLTRTQIRELFSRNRSESEITRALDALRRCDLAQCEVEGTGGRPAQRWFATH